MMPVTVAGALRKELWVNSGQKLQNFVKHNNKMCLQLVD
jgi:hypothetical protein